MSSMSKAKKRSTHPGNDRSRKRQGQQRRSVQASLRHRNRNRTWGLIGGLLVLIVGIVSLFAFLANQQTAQLPNGQENATTVITSLNPSTFATVGRGTAQSTLHPLTNAPSLKGADGKPIFLYVGAEYCLYCAAHRSAVIAALSRFGQFHALTPLISGEGNIPTLTFHTASYSSPYLDAQLVETGDNQPPPQTQPLDSLTSEQQQIFDQYNKPPYVEDTGKIPFLDVANQFVSLGRYYSPDILSGHSYQDIESQLKDPTSPICRAIVGAANCLTAAICSTTGNQPTNVCTASPIPALQQTHSYTAQSFVPPLHEAVLLSSFTSLWFERKDVQANRRIQ